MHSLVLEKAEETLERIFARLNINEGVHLYLCNAVESEKLVFNYSKRLEKNCSHLTYAVTEAEIEAYIYRFDLEVHNDPEVLELLARYVLLDCFLDVVRIIERAIELTESPQIYDRPEEIQND